MNHDKFIRTGIESIFPAHATGSMPLPLRWRPDRESTGAANAGFGGREEVSHLARIRHRPGTPARSKKRPSKVSLHVGQSVCPRAFAALSQRAETSSVFRLALASRCRFPLPSQRETGQSAFPAYDSRSTNCRNAGLCPRGVDGTPCVEPALGLSFFDFEQVPTYKKYGLACLHQRRCAPCSSIGYAGPGRALQVSASITGATFGDSYFVASWSTPQASFP